MGTTAPVPRIAQAVKHLVRLAERAVLSLAAAGEPAVPCRALAPAMSFVFSAVRLVATVTPGCAACQPVDDGVQAGMHKMAHLVASVATRRATGGSMVVGAGPARCELRSSSPADVSTPNDVRGAGCCWGLRVRGRRLHLAQQWFGELHSCAQRP